MNTNILSNIPPVSTASPCVTATVPNRPAHPATPPDISKRLLKL